MSIKPEVPLTISDSESDDGANSSWRDPYMTIYLNNSYPYNNQHGPPQGYWYLNAENAYQMFGEKYQQLDIIGKATECRLEYNKHQHRIDIWGDEEMIDKAKKSLELYCKNHQERKENESRKGKKWPRAERELTASEKKRKEKKEARYALEKSFEGIPVIHQPYSASFFIPNADIPVNLFIGDNNYNLHRISNECMAFVWYKSTTNTVEIAGPVESDVTKAASRVRNLFLKISRTLVIHSELVMQKPKTNSRTLFIKRPGNLIMPGFFSDQKSVLIKKLDMDVLSNQPYDSSEYLIDLFSTCDLNEDEPTLPPSLKSLTVENKMKLKKLLVESLENIRLQKGNISMKICFGHLLFPFEKTKYSQNTSFERVNSQLVEFRATDIELTPYFTDDASAFEKLLQYFSLNINDASHISDTCYLIQADHYLPSGPSTPKNENSLQHPKITTLINASFKKDGSLHFWDCVLDEGKALGSFKCLNGENNCDFAFEIKFGLRLSSDPNLSEAKFVKNLTLGSENRLRLLFGKYKYVPRTVIQRTRWKASWRGYTVEMIKDELWIIHKITKIRPDTVIDLSQIEPHHTSYKISLQKEQWLDRFSQNTGLSIGEAPRWIPGLFLCSEEENAGKYFDDATLFSKFLEKIIIAPWNK